MHRCEAAEQAAEPLHPDLPEELLENRHFEAQYGNDGATLLEMLVVLALLAILLTAAVPGFQKLHDVWTLLGGVQLLESSLYWGRMHAISVNDSLLLQVDPDGRGFRWIDPASGAPYAYSPRRLPGKVKIVGSPSRPLRFFQHGNAAPAGTYVLEGQAGRYRVIVNFMGRIRVVKD